MLFVCRSQDSNFSVYYSTLSTPKLWCVFPLISLSYIPYPLLYLCVVLSSQFPNCIQNDATAQRLVWASGQETPKQYYLAVCDGGSCKLLSQHYCPVMVGGQQTWASLGTDLSFVDEASLWVLISKARRARVKKYNHSNTGLQMVVWIPN